MTAAVRLKSDAPKDMRRSMEMTIEKEVKKKGGKEERESSSGDGE